MEGKPFCVTYLTLKDGFEKAVEQVYFAKEKMPEFYFIVIVKGLKQKSQIVDLSKRAFYLSRLNVYQYRSGFHKFMNGCAAVDFQSIFFNQNMEGIQIGTNSYVNPLKFEEELQ